MGGPEEDAVGDVMYVADDDSESDAREDVGVVTLSGGVGDAVERDGVERTAAREYTSTL